MPKFAYRATYTTQDGTQGVDTGNVTAPAPNQAASKIAGQLLKDDRAPQEVKTWQLPNSN